MPFWNIPRQQIRKGDKICRTTKVCSGGVLPPDYSASKQVLLFTANNTVNKSATITNDGWILIELTGAWTPCRATINGINVAAAQVTASNLTMASIGIYPVKKATW